VKSSSGDKGIPGGRLFQIAWQRIGCDNNQVKRCGSEHADRREYIDVVNVLYRHK
jgi:hypothetical protein